ncbi:MAG: helix-hairpin-helix domain-containing protein [Thermodesulfobacteriota bacterium]
MKYFSLGQQKILFFLACLILGILHFKFYDHPDPVPSEETLREFVVEVSGEVKNPGIYIFQTSPTLKETIDRAGGFKGAIQFDASSSSEVLGSGTLLTIVKEPPEILPFPPLSKSPPLRKEGHGGINHDEIKIKIGRMAANKLLVFSIPLDLNRASLEDLCLIPGIGESLAHEIVTYREKRKGFRSVEELNNVKGIGEKKYQTFKTFFTIRP